MGPCIADGVLFFNGDSCKMTHTISQNSLDPPEDPLSSSVEKIPVSLCGFVAKLDTKGQALLASYHMELKPNY